MLDSYGIIRATVCLRPLGDLQGYVGNINKILKRKGKSLLE